jgi:PST family polysaccharide transporter
VLVVQKEELTEATTSTVFWLNVALGTSLGLGLLALSAPIAAGFSAPRLTPVLWLLAAVFPITSLGAIHQALLERHSQFRKLARIEFLSSLGGLCVALVLAWRGIGVFSLACQMLTTALLSTGQLWLATRWVPRSGWDRKEFRAIWGFSGGMAGFTFIGFFNRNADAMVIGRVLGSVPLGIYSQAYKVMMFPLQSMTYVAGRALFPIMSRQQHDRPQMARLYFRSLRMIALVTAPMMAGLWVLREPFIEVTLGRQWADVIVILGWLAPVGFIQSLVSTTGTVFMATGRTDLLMRLTALGALLQVSSFLVGVRWGIEGVAMCYLVANVLNIAPSFAMTLHQLRSGYAALWQAVRQPLLFAAVMLLVIVPLTALLRRQALPSLPLLAIVALVGAGCYGALILLFSRAMFVDFKKILGSR